MSKVKFITRPIYAIGVIAAVLWCKAIMNEKDDDEKDETKICSRVSNDCWLCDEFTNKEDLSI